MKRSERGQSISQSSFFLPNLYAQRRAGLRPIERHRPTAGVSERLAAGVEDGKLDQAEADQKLADAEAKIADMVNNGRPERGGPAPQGQTD